MKKELRRMHLERLRDDEKLEQNVVVPKYPSMSQPSSAPAFGDKMKQLQIGGLGKPQRFVKHLSMIPRIFIVIISILHVRHNELFRQSNDASFFSDFSIIISWLSVVVAFIGTFLIEAVFPTSNTTINSKIVPTLSSEHSIEQFDDEKLEEGVNEKVEPFSMKSDEKTATVFSWFSVAFVYRKIIVLLSTFVAFASMLIATVVRHTELYRPDADKTKRNESQIWILLLLSWCSTFILLFQFLWFSRRYFAWWRTSEHIMKELIYNANEDIAVEDERCAAQKVYSMQLELISMKKSAFLIVFTCLLCSYAEEVVKEENADIKDPTKISDGYVHALDDNFDPKWALKVAKRHVCVFFDREQDVNLSMESVLIDLRKAARTLLFPNKDESERAIAAGVVRSGPIVFLAIDVREEISKPYLNRFSVSLESFSKDQVVHYRALEMRKDGATVKGPKKEDESKYAFSEADTVVQFVFDLRNRKEEKMVKMYMSESLSEADKVENPGNYDGLVKIVSHQVKDLMYSKSKKNCNAIFVSLPGCAHCEKFRKRLLKLITLFRQRGIDNMAFYEMDASRNEAAVIDNFKGFEKSYPFFALCPSTGACVSFKNFEGTSEDIQVFLQFYRSTENRGNDPKKQIFTREDRRNSAKNGWKDFNLPITGVVKHISQFEIDEIFQQNDERADNKVGTMIMFYAPWCKNSRRAMPHFASASEKMKMINFVAINCVTQDAACEKRLDGELPLIKGYAPGDREGVKYTDKKWEQNLMKFAMAIAEENFGESNQDEHDEL
eukprot:g1315.t1